MFYDLVPLVEIEQETEIELPPGEVVVEAAGEIWAGHVADDLAIGRGDRAAMVYVLVDGVAGFGGRHTTADRARRN